MLYVSASGIFVAALVFGSIWLAQSHGPGLANQPSLQEIQSRPNSVKNGETVTLTVQLDKAAPQGGAIVTLTSSDPAILTVDGSVRIAPGRTMGTGYSQVVRAPSYLSPVRIAANYNNTAVETEVNVLAQADQPSHNTQAPNKAGKNNFVPPNLMTATARPAPSTSRPATPDGASLKPAPLDPELLSRLDETQGRLSAEQAYWEGVKQHMPPSTSLRPEITSQLYAAQSSSQHCTKYRQDSDANALRSCLDSLNDHLNQLKIQH
jgi:hypothetical protein